MKSFAKQMRKRNQRNIEVENYYEDSEVVSENDEKHLLCGLFDG